MTASLEDLNSREAWQQQAPDVQSAVMTEVLRRARDNFAEYARLAITWERYSFIPHPLHALIYDSLRLCREAGKHCVLVLPPEHGKTFTVSKFIVSELARNTRIRVGLVSADDGLSKRNMIRIRKSIESELTAQLWPHIRPDSARSAGKSKGEWSVTRLYLEDNSDPAVEVFPLHGPVEGSRFDILWCDDISTRVCYESKAERDRVYDAFHLSFMNRLTDNGIAIVTNNCWHREDVINDATKEGKPFHVLWVGYRGFDSMYARVHNPVEGWPHDVELELPLWEGCPQRKLQAKFGASEPAYKRLYEQKATLQSDLRFGPCETWPVYDAEELMREYELGGKIYAWLDPAGGKDAKHHDFASICTVFISQSGICYVLSMWCAKVPPEEQVAMLWSMHRQYGLDGSFIEVLAKDQKWIRIVFDAHQKKLREAGDMAWQMPWTLRGQSRSKASRIEEIVTPIRQGWVKFPEDFTLWRHENNARGHSWREFINQADDHPAKTRLEHDDNLDALSGAVDIAKALGPGLPRIQRDHMEHVRRLREPVKAFWPDGKPVVEQPGKSLIPL